MDINKRVTIKISDDEVAKIIGSHCIELLEDEYIELDNSYPTLGEYTFKILTEHPTYELTEEEEFIKEHDPYEED